MAELATAVPRYELLAETLALAAYLRFGAAFVRPEPLKSLKSNPKNKVASAQQ